MTTAPTFYPTVPSLQQLAQRAWAIRHLHENRSIDRLAALQSLDTIVEQNPSPALRRLCIAIARALYPELAHADPETAEPIVGVYAR